MTLNNMPLTFLEEHGDSMTHASLFDLVHHLMGGDAPRSPDRLLRRTRSQCIPEIIGSSPERTKESQLGSER